MSRHATPEERARRQAQVRELHALRRSVTEISRSLDVSHQTIYNDFQALGLKPYRVYEKSHPRWKQKSAPAGALARC